MIGLASWVLGATAVLVACGWAYGPGGLAIAGLIYVVGGVLVLPRSGPFR